MSSGLRVLAADAQPIADDLLERLGPACWRLEVAGSLRRGRPDVGDLELVAVPKIATTEEQDGLWGVRQVEVSELGMAVEQAIRDRILAPHPEDPKFGARYAKLAHVASGLQVDLFVVRPPAQWGVLFLVRTGPAAFSQAFVTDARRRGYHVVDGALHRGSLGCGAYTCPIVDTPEERDVFEAVGRPWVPPDARL